MLEFLVGLRPSFSRLGRVRTSSALHSAYRKRPFGSSQKYRRKKSEESRSNSLNFLQGVLLPPFGAKRWRQKHPQGTSAGIGRRFLLRGTQALRRLRTPAPGVRTAIRSFSGSGAMRSLRCAARNFIYVRIFNNRVTQFVLRTKQLIPTLRFTSLGMTNRTSVILRRNPRRIPT